MTDKWEKWWQSLNFEGLCQLKLEHSPVATLVRLLLHIICYNYLRFQNQFVDWTLPLLIVICSNSYSTLTPTKLQSNAISVQSLMVWFDPGHNNFHHEWYNDVLMEHRTCDTVDYFVNHSRLDSGFGQFEFHRNCDIYSLNFTRTVIFTVDWYQHVIYQNNHVDVGTLHDPWQIKHIRTWISWSLSNLWILRATNVKQC